MPQLDVFSYVSTIAWVTIAFLGFVYINYTIFLPKIAQNLKLHKLRPMNIIYVTQKDNNKKK